MSLLEPLPCDDDFIFGDSKRVSGSLSNMEECVDPQYTVKPYGTTQLGYMTPETSPTDTTPRRESFDSNYFCGSSAASSFMSYSGNMTPSLTTPGSSASNSRRQSMLLPEYHQYYSSATSSSPSEGPRGPNEAIATGQYPLQEYLPPPYLASTNVGSLISDGTRACVPESEVATAVDDFVGKVPRQWQSDSPQTASSSFYRTLPNVPIDESTNLDYDLFTKLNSPITARPAHPFGLSQPLFVRAHPSIFGDTPSLPERSAYNPEDNCSPNAPSLGPAFERAGVKYDTDSEIADSDMDPDVATTGLPFGDVFRGRPPIDQNSRPSDDDLERGHERPRIIKSYKRRHKQSHKPAACEWRSYKCHESYKIHRCREPLCDYACNRQEHLKRHESSKHRKDEWHPCAFPGCIDRKTGQHRRIVARLDNLKAHYTKTHFNYGSSENGGKNDRKSMKAAHEMGLSMYDSRWALLIGGKMNVNQEIKDKHGHCCFLHVWKMLGYSILETRDIKVKDVLPDTKEAEEKTLAEYDPRWKALWDGTLTFEKAMDTGKFMPESKAQGLLGVTMLETEAMGIKHLDPRWTMLLGGRMSVEQSEMLGVKQRNPKWKDLVARRRTRCGIEKL